MKFIKTYPSASATRPGAAVGTVTRKYAILLAMGLTASIASEVLAAVETPTGRGGRVSNSFVTVEGEGVGVLDDGSISYDEGATGDIIVTARPGWRVNGQKSVTLNPARGSRQPLGATSDLHEDQEHIHFFQRSESDEHVPDTYMEISAEANPASAITMYALPDTSTVVTVSATKKLVKTASHRKVTRYYKCACGAVHDPDVEYGAPYEVKPDRYVWKASGPGASFADSTWTGEMSKGLAQKVEFTVKAKRPACVKCECEASTEATIDVHELSIERPDYVGLDMTDAKRGEYIYKSATAKIDPAPVKAEYEWQKCGRCEFYGATNKEGVTYRASDATGPSGSYLEEELVVRATAKNIDGLSAEANCTTNFTVVRVDVALSGVGEYGDETALPGVVYAADADDGELTKLGLRSLMPVQVLCYPYDVPGDVNVAVSSGAKLYEITEYEDDKASKPEPSAAVPAKSSYPCDKIASVAFGIHGHVLPDFEHGELIAAGHPKSGAHDKALFNVVPPPPIMISNLRLISPSKSGDWPYDPIWDDQDWSLTVNGSKAVECAEDVDQVDVTYNLNIDALKVDIQMYIDAWGWSNVPVGDTVAGTTFPGQNRVNCWEITETTEVECYICKVYAESRYDDSADLKKTTAEIMRDVYYKSDNAFLVMNMEKVGTVSYWDEALAKIELALTASIISGMLLYDAPPAAGFLGGIALSVPSALLPVPKWMQEGTTIYAGFEDVECFEWKASTKKYELADSVMIPGYDASPAQEVRSQFRIVRWEYYAPNTGPDEQDPKQRKPVLGCFVSTRHYVQDTNPSVCGRLWAEPAIWMWAPIPRMGGYGLACPDGYSYYEGEE